MSNNSKDEEGESSSSGESVDESPLLKGDYVKLLATPTKIHPNPGDSMFNLKKSLWYLSLNYLLNFY